MREPLVSIVIPVYNVESYIEECLKTALYQSYENIEIVCVDDVGNDGSMDIVRSYARKDSRIKVINHEKNKGVAQARNTGLEHVSGDYVFFLDSDDWLAADAIEKLVCCARLEEADIVVGHGLAFSNDASEETHLATKSMNSFLTLPKENKVIGKKSLLMANQIPCVSWGRLFRTDFLLSNQLKFISENVRHEDNGFHLKYLACNPVICFVSNEIYYYRIHGDSIVGKLRNGGAEHRTAKEDLQRVLNDAFEFIRTKKPEVFDFVKDSFWNDFALRGLGYVFYWGRYWKYMRVGPVVLIKKGVSSDGKWCFLKVLGIEIYKKPFVF